MPVALYRLLVGTRAAAARPQLTALPNDVMSIRAQASYGPATGAVGSAARDTESSRIQTLRGIACILLVAFHVVGLPTSGLRVPDDSIWRFLMELVEPLRMPLFTFLSGYVYAYRPVLTGTGPLFLKKKVRRLLFPLVSVATIHFFVQQVVPGTSSRRDLGDFWRIYFFPYEHFWFLQAIALIFVLVAWMDHQGALSSIRACIAALGIALLAHFTMEFFPTIFSLNKAFYLLPFFFAGLGANRFHRQFWSQPLKLAAPIVFAVTLLPYAAMAWSASADLPTGAVPWVTTISISGIFSLMYFVRTSRLLAWIGGYSFSIYLYHVFFTAGSRIGLNALFELPIPALICFGLIAGVLGPIVVEIALRPSRVARNMFLGQS